MPFERGGTKPEGETIFGNGKCELNATFSATMVTSPEGRDGKCEGRNETCEFLARESVSSSPIVRFFGKGKCKFIANFSATMVTSLPSLSVCISLSHRKYLTHNIGSASALPIIQREREIDGSDVTSVALKLAKKFALFLSKTLKLAKNFALFLAKNLHLSFCPRKRR